MAGGTQSPRQKMINLMYLVFIAMIAMNVDKEILNAFKIFDLKFTSSNSRLADDNQLAMAGLEAKALEQPAKYKPLLGKAERVKQISDEFYQYLASIKDTLTEGVDTSSYANLDKTAVLDERWFTGDRYTKKGEAFLAKIETYKADMKEALGDEFSEVNSIVERTFAVEPQTNKDGKEIAWLRYNFEGYPLAASITRFTQMQNDIKTAESEVYSSLLQGQLSKDVSLSNYEAIVIPEKTAFFSGESFKGKVVLGRFDNSLNFDKVIINGTEVDNLQAGQVVLDFPAGNVGTRKITGELVYTEDGQPKSIPINSEYAVINKPNSATISADKMNVVYRGVANPMTISFAGVADNNVSASAPGLSKGSGSSYTMNPGTGREVTISVSGTLADGSKVSDSKQFRIKDIPSPTGTVRGEDGILKMQRNSLEISTVGADLPDFDFDLDLRVTGFKFNVPGQPTVQVSGNKLDSRAKDVLRRAQRGSTVQIFDISASIAGNSSYRLKKVSPVLVELTN
ncbi:gliding motility protein GldM [Leeuwenhoekiella marinoflava]|uniref:Protein involved in gliding motility GldM n=2 Tax=Leeuwenhoekiella marinoflava TaxID=988 RepID=A0A4V1KRI7_9FLAO|nr:gliding motility protein GldM [Leeuwenhoekiella marinoflava]RXG25052.1 protein involved in gliding motility GldM [Leeuwenhoekiella marinoflava]SHF90462.1 protein involved in gliding motility GldM [Leeuwenhoekiella marinoflava DSM 3653]